MVDQQIIKKYNEELLFGQPCILQSEMKNISEGEYIPTTLDTTTSNKVQKLETSKAGGIEVSFYSLLSLHHGCKEKSCKENSEKTS